VLVLFAGMIGFGAMGQTHGFDAWMTGLTSLLMFALPGQVVLLEMLISGSSLLAIAFAVTLTSARFVTMVVTLFPQLHPQDRNRGLYAWVHLLAMTAWAVRHTGALVTSLATTTGQILTAVLVDILFPQTVVDIVPILAGAGVMVVALAVAAAGRKTSPLRT
jgi:predicted branched-subunit amino acid permease